MDEDKTVNIGKYKVKVLRSVCIGAATCVAVSPNVFVMDGENKAVFKDGATDNEANVLMAAQACPVKAVVITNVDTGEQVWPI